MAIRSRESYIESLRRQKPEHIFMDGEKVESVVDAPGFRKGINSIGIAYEVASDPRYSDLTTLNSPLINERISRWAHIMENEQDAIARVRLMRGMGEHLVPCPYRCMTSPTLTAAWIISYDIDKKYNTSYHQRVVNMAKHVQRNDLVMGASLVDPKGDRSLRPGKQSDPDMYLHIVARSDDGIVVRGAKAHDTAAPYTNMLCVAPLSRALREDEKDYAVGFFTPVDTEGITFISRPAPDSIEPADMENTLCAKCGGHAHSYTIYNDVFIPWERVFMAGEYEFVGPLMNIHAAFDLMDVCSCGVANTDLAIGAVALVADCNGIEQAAHIREYLTNMISNAEIPYSCALAAAVEGKKHESGAYLPDILPVEVGKVYAARKLGENRYYMQEAAGGSVRTMPLEKDFQNPETKRYLEKYLKGKEGMPAEHRIRALRLIYDLTASGYAGWNHAMRICEGGAPQALRLGTLAGYALERSKARAKRAAGIE